MYDLMKKLTNDIGVSSSATKQNLSVVDVRKAIEKLAVLGGGFRVVKMGNGGEFVLSVPMELNVDHEELIEAAENEEMIVEASFRRTHGWSGERFHMVISPLLHEGMIWVDQHNGAARRHGAIQSRAQDIQRRGRDVGQGGAPQMHGPGTPKC